MVKDGLVFKDEDGQVIFNQYSFCELVKHLLVELVGISYAEASQTVERSPMSCLITGLCLSTMATVTGGKKAFRRSQRIWMPMKLWKIRSWRNTT